VEYHDPAAPSLTLIGLHSQLTLTVGILNVGDVFPDRLTNVQSTYTTFGGAYLYGVNTPIGTDGRSYYVRLSVRF
jgi:iron complex outermembrane receptor protein